MVSEDILPYVRNMAGLKNVRYLSKAAALMVKHFDAKFELNATTKISMRAAFESTRKVPCVLYEGDR